MRVSKISGGGDSHRAEREFTERKKEGVGN